MDNLRTFIAIDLPDDIRGRMHAAISSLDHGSREVNWVKPENIHITLKFLGNTEPGTIEKIKEAIGSSVAGIKPMLLSINGIGGFPSLKSPRVLWAGVLENPELTRLHANIEERLTTAGFERDSRVFHPHITLCRIKSIRDSMELGAAANASGIAIKETFTADSVTIYSSVLSSQGSTYTVLERIALA